MRTFRFHALQRLPRPLDEVFPFFADARNLQDITPPWLHFRVEAVSDEPIREGTLIDYRLRVRGLPLRWRSRITRWEPPHRFVDEQIVGPYKLWRHLHTFRADGDQTIAEDVVDYAIPGGPLFEGAVERLLVGPDVRRIFAYRRARLSERFDRAGQAVAAG